MSCARFVLPSVFFFVLVGRLPVTAQVPGEHAGDLYQILPQSDTTSLRVDCGGPAFTDSRGQAWEADAHFVGGGTISYPGKIKGTDMQLLYQSERYNDPAKTPMKYTFPVPNGNYNPLHSMIKCSTHPGKLRWVF